MLSGEDIAGLLLANRLPLTAFVASVTRDFHLAEDIFQEVSVKAVGRAGEFASAEHALNWFRVAGRHRAVDVLRSRHGRYVGLSEEVLAILASDWPDASAADRSKEALGQCLAELSPYSREILRLRYFEKRSGIEVAELLERKLETIYQALARIHRTLADCVRKQLKGEALP